MIVEGVLFMTEDEVQRRAVEFMKRQEGIAPWSFRSIHEMGPCMPNDTSRRWAVTFNNEDPQWKDWISFHVIVDDATGHTCFVHQLFREGSEEGKQLYQEPKL